MASLEEVVIPDFVKTLWMEDPEPVDVIKPVETEDIPGGDVFSDDLISHAQAQPLQKRKVSTYECSVCAEQLPSSEFLNCMEIYLPIPCRAHLVIPWRLLTKNASQPVDDTGSQSSESISEPVCQSCLASYLLVQFETRGADRIQCIKPSCKPPRTADAWKYHTVHFLPEDAREAFTEELARELYKKDRWICPSNCGCLGYVATPERTRGWPNVICPTCNKNFCARCRAHWHSGLSCRHYQRAKRWEKHASAPKDVARSEIDDSSASQNVVPSNLLPDGTEFEHGSALQTKKALYVDTREMQHRGARLCPRCEAPIIKDGGCNNMRCTRCDLYFHWRQADPVVAVKQEQALVQSVRAGPFRPVGKWVWEKRAEWGIRREKQGVWRAYWRGWRGWRVWRQKSVCRM